MYTFRNVNLKKNLTNQHIKQQSKESKPLTKKL